MRVRRHGGLRTLAVEGRLEALENLRRDEEVLAAGVRRARVATLHGPVVSLGVSQPSGAPAAQRARALGIPVVRRRSGGTGLLHQEGDIVWAIVLPRSDPRVGRDYARAYARLGASVVQAFSDVGLPGRWTEALGVSDEYCLLAPRGQVLTVHGRVVGGAAQHATSVALLHHGTINVTVDRERLAMLFDLRPDALGERIVGLQELLGVRGPTELEGAIARRLGEWIAD